MMRYRLLILFCSISYISCNNVGISPKLDFGESDSGIKLFESPQYSHHRTVLKNKRQESSTSGDFDGIGVVCVTEGCNKTDNTKETVQTDVLVHVQTSVDLPKNKTKIVEDTPDVPIIIGTAGTKYENHQTVNQKPLVVSGFEDNSRSPQVPTTFYPYGTYNRPSLQKVDVNIKTLPPVMVTMTSDGRSIKDIRYNSNGIQVRVPYFEPSYHNHYFGEIPPPQMIWYPRTGNVNYQTKPSLWPGTTGYKYTMVPVTPCNCKNNPTSGLQWHPAPNRRVYNEDPGTQINDKLAPLN